MSPVQPDQRFLSSATAPAVEDAGRAGLSSRLCGGSGKSLVGIDSDSWPLVSAIDALVPSLLGSLLDASLLSLPSLRATPLSPCNNRCLIAAAAEVAFFASPTLIPAPARAPLVLVVGTDPAAGDGFDTSLVRPAAVVAGVVFGLARLLDAGDDALGAIEALALGADASATAPVGADPPDLLVAGDSAFSTLAEAKAALLKLLVEAVAL